ncbi:MAG: diacylglycerol/lipid kinase family protein, partial [Syntrophothermus sp.]
MKVAFLINKSSGSSDTDEGLKSLIQSRISNTDFESYFIDCCNSDSEKQINDLINDELDILVASGGDGTINSAASKIIDKNISLGILPSGTLNHFAKDLN